MSLLSKMFKDQRGEQIRDLAYPLKMEFEKKDEYGMINLLGDFQLFKQGGGRKIKNILRKEDEWLKSKVAIFDYQYTISTGKSAHTYHQTVFFIQSKQLALPQFLMKPEHFFHRVGKFLNLTQDIEFEAHPEFSDKYLIQGEDPSMVKDMVPEQLARFFTIEDKWSLEGLNFFMILYQKHKRLPPSTIQEFYEKGMEIVEWLAKSE